MKHLTVTYEGEPFNFEMVHREYSKFKHRRMSVQIFDRPVVLKAFDQLQVIINYIYFLILSYQSNQRKYYSWYILKTLVNSSLITEIL